MLHYVVTIYCIQSIHDIVLCLQWSKVSWQSLAISACLLIMVGQGEGEQLELEASKVVHAVSGVCGA